MVKLKDKINNKYTYFCISIFLLLLIMLFQLGKLSQPYFPDEIGYWAAGAWFNGINWSSVMSKIGYYGYGYGLILAPLFMLDNPFYMFCGAVVINACMIIGLFLIVYFILKEIFDDIDYKKLLFVSFVSCCYTYIVVYVHLSMSEICLTLFSAIYIYLMILTVKKTTVFRIVCLSLVIGYLVSIHLRSLIIVIITAIYFVLLAVLKKINWIKLILIFTLTAITLIIVFYIKDMVVAGIYTDSVSLTHIDYNDNISEKIGSIQSYLNFDFIFNYGICLIAKVFYLSISSFYLFDFAVVYLFYKVYRSYKANNSVKTRIYLFLILFIFIWIAYAAFISGKTEIGRVDELMYGRYIENTIPVFLAIGAMEFINSSKRKSIIMYSAIMCFSFSIICYWYLLRLGLNGTFPSMLPIQMSGIVGLPRMKTLDKAFGVTLYAALLIFVVGIIMYFWAKLTPKFALILISIAWIYIAYNGLNNFVYNTYETIDLMQNSKLNQFEVISKTAEYLRSLGQEEIYYIHEKEDTETPSYFQMFDLQYDLLNMSLNVIESRQLPKIPDDSIVVLHHSNLKYNEILESDKLKIIYENEFFSVGEKEN